MKTFEFGVFGVCRSNAPGRRSNAKAKGKTRPLAIRTPLGGVRTPRPNQGGVRTPLPGVRTPEQFLPCFVFFSSVSSCILLSRYTWIVLGHLWGTHNIDIAYVAFDLLIEQDTDSMMTVGSKDGVQSSESQPRE